MIQTEELVKVTGFLAMIRDCPVREAFKRTGAPRKYGPNLRESAITISGKFCVFIHGKSLRVAIILIYICISLWRICINIASDGSNHVKTSSNNITVIVIYLNLCYYI